ncbi:MAG: type I-D CRISPR-associated helicase Cas3' [Methanomicrobiales archaeon]|nr:type I-D CRISPR-associated helicase Cas3' [Methanomicrobiales archaeon]MDI6876076.1 type I-D CRISPR-associated helicase Cas3' [Methanomicrobiales archaeon]
MPLHIDVKPAFIPYSGFMLGADGTELMVHQQEVRESEEDLIILDAPTASGKTLGMLTSILDSRGNGVFVYPTNELIRDQGRSIASLLRRAGRNPTLIPMEREFKTAPHDTGDVILAVVSGASLEGVARKGEAIQRILHLTNHGRQLILLTNIDTLYQLFQLRYYRGHKLLVDFLHTRFHTLAIDELHMYSGIALSNLIYLIWLLKSRFDRILVSSATHHGATDVLKEIIPSNRKITAIPQDEPEGRVRQIRHDVRLDLHPYDRYLEERERTEILEQIERFLQSGAEKILVIVNSVVFSEILADRLEEKYGQERVGRINGMVPAEYRAQKEITVGTSAIEVGVDFDVDALIFQGSDAASFLQRFGRVGRHRPGTAIGYVPSESYRLLEKKMRKQGSATISAARLNEFVTSAIPTLESYAEFSKSIYGAALFLSLLQGMWQQTRGKDLNYEELERQYTELRPPFFVRYAYQDIGTIAYPRTRDLISQGGARGDILSIPVYLERYRCYARMDIFELLKTEFECRPVDRIEAEKPSWMRDADGVEIPVVLRMQRAKAWVKGSWRGELLNTKVKRIVYARTERDKNLSIYLEHKELERIAERLLNDKIVYATNNYRIKDWRFNTIRNANDASSCLVVGLDALVQRFAESMNM